MSTNTNSISWSEIRTWTTCRMRHHWSYGRNLQSRAFRRAPNFGTVGHVAIAAHLRQKPWQVAVDNWKDKYLVTNQLWEDELDEMNDVISQVKQIIPRYLAAYPLDFRAVVVEQEFRVRVPRVRTVLDGFWDAIVEDRSNRLWLMDHKFPQNQFRPIDDLDLDGQIGIYQYAARQSGYPVAGIIYNQILAKAPKQPSLNKNGTMSKSDIITDWDTYKSALLANGLDPDDYADMREKLAKKKFFDRHFLYRNNTEVDIFVADVRERMRDARRKGNRIYMTPNAINCRNCDFKELCIATVKAADVETLIKLDFQPRSRRQDEEEPDAESI